jgi:hypothetical protein
VQVEATDVGMKKRFASRDRAQHGRNTYAGQPAVSRRLGVQAIAIFSPSRPQG